MEKLKKPKNTGSTFSKLDKKGQLEMRKQAYYKWFLRKAAKTTTPIFLDRIAADCGMTMEEIKYYMVKDKWEERYKKDMERGGIKRIINEKVDELTKEEQQKFKDMSEALDILNESPLNDRKKLFALYYLQTFDAKTAAIKAGYSKNGSYVRGGALLKEPEVAELIEKLKNVMQTNLFIDAYDIIKEYVSIAFADITEFVEFEGDQVYLKSSKDVNGRLIQEVKKGRDGISVKLIDKKFALEKLEKLFDAIPDKHLELQREKLELQKQLAKGVEEGDSKVVIINDII